jgi:hypothetical protein
MRLLSRADHIGQLQMHFARSSFCGRALQLRPNGGLLDAGQGSTDWLLFFSGMPR